jgi:hypothetical protein
MNRNDFIRIIHDTSAVDRQTIGEVRELLDLFPYFQSAHLLLLKGLYDTSDVKFESQLRQSAIYIADREILYYLLKKESQSAPAHQEVINPVSYAESDTSDSGQTVIETGKNSQEIIEEYEKSHTESVENEKQENPSYGVPRSLLINEESDEESSNFVFLLEEDAENEKEEFIYINPSIIVPDYDDLLELDLQEGGSISSEKGLTSVEEPEKELKIPTKKVQAELIDKFIIANPRIEPVRDRSDHQAEDISKQSAEEKGGFITETLAKIYINQGYYSKAIDIYEKLSLKFPEKSSYFATQIEKVKGLIK